MTAGDRGVTDLLSLARAETAERVAWAQASDDLNVNLLVLESGDLVASHVNADADVLVVGVDGAGILTLDGTPHRVTAGSAIVIPRGARRSVSAAEGRFAYLTCHRRRGGLWPAGASRPGG